MMYFLLGLVGTFVVLVGGMSAWFLMQSKGWVEESNSGGTFWFFGSIVAGWAFLMLLHTHPLIAGPLFLGIVAGLICSFFYGFYQAYRTESSFNP